jgi:hypothetical protein
MKEGSSVVERREGGEEYGISTGPSDDSVVIVVMISASHVKDDEEEGMDEIENEEVGFLWRKGRREGLWLGKSGMLRKWFEFEKRR